MDEQRYNRLKKNLNGIWSRVIQACERSGRDPESITLVAVTKSVDEEIAGALIDAGALDLGESRINEAERKQKILGERGSWHLIGHLQRNKVKKALPLFSLIHSVDSARLLKAISKVCERKKTEAHLLLEVNVSGEEAKHGFAPSALPEALDLAFTLPGLKPRGLMTMAPYDPNPEQARPFFNQLKTLQLQALEYYPDLTLLSMGMSGDFVPAVEEGATHIRVGTALFEGL